MDPCRLFMLVLLADYTRGLIPEFQNYSCPEQCLCLSEIQVLCNTGSLTEFPSAIPNVTQDISITNQRITLLPKYAFKGLKMLKKITLDTNRISIIEPFAFKGLQDVEEISLRWNPIETIPGFAFAGIRNVTHIFLGYNKIKSISGYAFAGSEHIEMLVINDNPIKTIESFAFAGLKYVRFLLISSSVKHLHQDAFNGLECVEHLKLDFFNLRKLKPNTFRGLTNCRVLTIDNSDLGLVEDGAWAGLINVSQVHVLNSKIDQISDLSIAKGAQVQHLQMSGNHVLSFSPELKVEEFLSYGLKSIQLIKNYVPCSCEHSFLLDMDSDLLKLEVVENQNFCISPHYANGQTIKQMLSMCHKSNIGASNSERKPTASRTEVKPGDEIETLREDIGSTVASSSSASFSTLKLFYSLTIVFLL